MSDPRGSYEVRYSMPSLPRTDRAGSARRFEWMLIEQLVVRLAQMTFRAPLGTADFNLPLPWAMIDALYDAVDSTEM